MAGLYPIGQMYLNNQNVISNGGIAGLILNSLQFQGSSVSTSAIQNVGFWTSYALGFLFNSTRLQPIYQNSTYQLNNYTSVYNVNRPYTIMMIFWLVTFFVLIFAILVCSIVQCVKDKKERKEIKKLKFKKSRTKRSCFYRRRTRRIIVLFSMALVVLLWIVFISMFCASQYIVSSKFSRSSSNTNGSGPQQYDSVNDAITLSFNYLNNFFNIITNKTGDFLGSSLSTLSTNLRNQMSLSISSFGSQVLIAFNITNLFHTAQMLLTSINQVVTSMTYINSNCQTILGQIDNTKGSVNVYQNNLNKYLTTICKQVSMNQTLQNQCQVLLLKNTLFQTNIQTSLVSSSSSVIMLFVLQQYNINITAITASFYVVDSNFQTKLSVLYNDTVNSFDISSYLNLVTTIWNNLVNMINPSIATVNSYSTSMSSTFDTISKYENLVIIILIFLIFIMILFVLFFSFRDSIQDPSINIHLNFFIQFMFIFVLLISAILSVVVLISSNFSQSEICNQINTTSGIAVLDQMLNEDLSVPWSSIVQTMSQSNQGMQINLVQPTNIISGIKDRCQNTSMGLLSVLGMGNFVNMSQVVQSQSVITIVVNAKNSSLNAFLSVNPTQIIPSNLTAFFAQTATVISYFDGIDYSQGIQELQKPLVGIVNFPGYFNDLSSFAIQSSKLLGWNSDLTYLNDTVNALVSIAPTWVNTQSSVNTLAQNFQVLQTNRNNSVLMNQLLLTITSVQTLFANTSLLTTMFSSIYDSQITINLLNTVQQLLTTGLNLITFQMIPCGNLSLVFQAITTTFCSSTNFNVSLATFGILLLIETVMCQIISVIILASIFLRLNSEPNVSTC